MIQTLSTVADKPAIMVIMVIMMMVMMVVLVRCLAIVL